MEAKMVQSGPVEIVLGSENSQEEQLQGVIRLVGNMKQTSTVTKQLWIWPSAIEPVMFNGHAWNRAPSPLLDLQVEELSMEASVAM